MKLKPYDPNAKPVFAQDETQSNKYKLKPYDPNAKPVFAEPVQPKPAEDKGKGWYQKMMTGHIPDDLEVSPSDQESPNWYAVKSTVRDMGEATLNALPEALAYALPAVMTGGASIPLGLEATGLESMTAAFPTLTRAGLTGINTGVISGVDSAGKGNGINEVSKDIIKGGLTGAALDLAGEGVAVGAGKAISGMNKGARYLGSLGSDKMAKQRAAQILMDSSKKLTPPQLDSAVANADRIEEALNRTSGVHTKPVRLNSAEAIDSPGLVSLNQKLTRVNSHSVEKAVNHRGEMNSAVTDLVERGAGAKGAGTLADTKTAVEGGINDFNRGLNTAEDGLHQEFTSAAGEPPTLEATGEAGRQALDSQRHLMKTTVVDPAYDDIANVQIQGGGLADKLQQIANPTSAGENPNNIPSAFLARIKKVMASGIDNQSSTDLATLRDFEKEARQMKVNARTAQGNANQSLARRYQQIEEAIRGTIDNGSVASDAAPMLAESFRSEADNLLSTSASNLVIDGHVQKAMISDAPDWFLNMNRNLRSLPDVSEISKQAAANALKRAAEGTAKGPLDEMVIDAARGEIEQAAMRSVKKVATGSLKKGDVFTSLNPKTGDMVEARVVDAADNKITVDYGGDRVVMDDTFGNVQMIGNPSSEILAPEAQKLRAANRTFNQFSEAYKEGRVGEVLKKRGYEHTVKNADVMQRFFPKGTKNASDAAIAFRKAANGDPQAWQALEDSVVRDMLDTVAPTGKVEPKKFASWYANHRAAMQQYPELQKKIGNVQRAQNALDDFWTRSGDLRKKIETNVLKEFLKADPDKAIGRILDSRNPITEVNNLLQLVGDNPHALNGIKRETMAYLKGHITTTRQINGQYVLSGAGMKKTYAKLKPTLQKIYKPAELRDIEIAIEAEERMNSAWNPQLSGSNTSEILSSGNIDKTAAGLRTVSGLAANSLFVVIDGASKLIRSFGHKLGVDRTSKILLKAMDDPHILRELVNTARKPKPDSAIVKFIHKYGFDDVASAAAKTVTTGTKAKIYDETK